MIAYGNHSLDKLTIQSEVNEALRRRLISRQEKDTIEASHPVELYHPNIFIRIGLFLATNVIVSMTFGLFILIFGWAFNADKGIAVACFLFSFLLYAALELLVSKRKHFRSGVDDALLWLSLAFFLSACLLLVNNVSALLVSLLCMALSTLATARFANPLAAIILFCSTLSVIFNLALYAGDAGKVGLPFVMFIVSGIIYLVNSKITGSQLLRHYAWCSVVLKTLSLLTIYFSLNYFAVRELSSELLGFKIPATASIPGGWFFWGATAIIPILYLWRGLYKKDAVMLRVGVLTCFASVFTLTHYYVFAPAEQLLIGGGFVLLLFVYLVNKYLATPKHGISNEEPDVKEMPLIVQVESLVVAESLQQNAAPSSPQQFRYGGGSSGGAGATGDY